MLGRFFQKLALRSDKSAALAKYQVNFGAVLPKYERLKDASVENGLSIDDERFPSGVDIWTLTFETYAFQLVYDPNPHRLDDGNPLGRMRLVTAYFSPPGEREFKVANRRFWFRQLDEMMAFMPEVADLLKPDA